MARRSLILLIVLNLLTYMDRFVLAGVEKFIEADLLPGDPNAKTKMGFLAVVLLTSYMFCSPVFGILGDRTSRWLLVGIGTIAGSIATGFGGLATTFSMLLIARMLVGVSEAAYAPVAPTILSDLYPVEKRGRMLALFYAAMPVGGALGYAFGGIILSFTSWHWAFILLAPPGIIAGIIACCFKDPRHRTAAQPLPLDLPAAPVDVAPADSDSHAPAQTAVATIGSSKPRTLFSARLATYAQLFRIRSYAYCSAGMTAMSFAFGAITFFMPRYLADRYMEQYSTSAAPLDPTAVAAKVAITFGAISAVTGLSATLAGGFLGDRLRTRYPGAYFLVSGVGLLLGFPLFLLALYSPFPFAWLTLVLAVFTLFFNTGPTNTILANVTPAPIRATGFALNILIIHLLGDALSPVLTGVIADHTSLRTAFTLTSTAFLLGGTLWLMGARHLARDTANAETANALTDAIAKSAH